MPDLLALPLAGLPHLDPEPFRKATLVLAGAGNIGSPLASFVARLGVGRLRIVDRDRVEQKNLATQDFQANDVGRFKAEVLADRLRGRFPGLIVEAYSTDLEDLPLETFNVDVLLGALDSRRARQVLVSEIAWPLGVPVLDGGVGEGLLGRVQLFVPRPETACLECGWGEADYRRLSEEYPCVPGAVAAAAATISPAFAGAVVAGLMTGECVRLLAGQGPAESQEIAFDLWHRRFLVTRLRRASRCRFDHAIVADALRMGKAFAATTLGDVVGVVEQRFGASPVHLECRRGLLSGAGFESHRCTGLEHWRAHAGELLAAHRFHPGDRIRVRSRQGSVFVVPGE